MKKKILFLILLVPALAFSQQRATILQVNNKTVTFKTALPVNSLIHEIDSTMILQLTTAITATSTTMSDVFASGNYIIIGRNLNIPVDTTTAGTGLVNKTRMSHLSSYPTLNQNTTGTAAGLASQYIDWNSSSGGSSIANKPILQTIINGTGFVKASGTTLSYDNSTYLTDDVRWYTNETGISHFSIAPVNTVGGKTLSQINLFKPLVISRWVGYSWSGGNIPKSLYVYGYSLFDSTITYNNIPTLGSTPSFALVEGASGAINKYAWPTGGSIYQTLVATENDITGDYAWVDVIPAGYMLEYVIIYNECDGCDTTNLDMGTSAGIGNVFLGTLIPSGAYTTIAIGKVFSLTSATTLYLSDDAWGGSHWVPGAHIDVKLVYRKIN